MMIISELIINMLLALEKFVHYYVENDSSATCIVTLFLGQTTTYKEYPYFLRVVKNNFYNSQVSSVTN